MKKTTKTGNSKWSIFLSHLFVLIPFSLSAEDMNEMPSYNNLLQNISAQYNLSLKKYSNETNSSLRDKIIQQKDKSITGFPEIEVLCELAKRNIPKATYYLGIVFLYGYKKLNPDYLNAELLLDLAVQQGEHRAEKHLLDLRSFFEKYYIEP